MDNEALLILSKFCFWIRILPRDLDEGLLAEVGGVAREGVERRDD